MVMIPRAWEHRLPPLSYLIQIFFASELGRDQQQMAQFPLLKNDLLLRAARGKKRLFLNPKRRFQVTFSPR